MNESPLPCFYSQLGEDMFLYNTLINQEVPGGRYVEVGALCGAALSNTKFLQNHLGFRGVLIEANPLNGYYLQKNRPHDSCYVVAVGEREQEKAPFYCLSGMNTLALSHLVTDEGPICGTDTITSGTIIEVPVFNLSSVLVDHFRRVCRRSPEGTALEDVYIDFMSIDVEGGELGVLKSMDWSMPTGIICIEMHESQEKQNIQCRRILEDNGFTLFQRLICNEFWVNLSYYRGHLFFKPAPPTLEGNMMISEEHRREVAEAILSHFSPPKK